MRGAGWAHPTPSSHSAISSLVPGIQLAVVQWQTAWCGINRIENDLKPLIIRVPPCAAFHLSFHAVFQSANLLCMAGVRVNWSRYISGGKYLESLKCFVETQIGIERGFSRVLLKFPAWKLQNCELYLEALISPRTRTGNFIISFCPGNLKSVSLKLSKSN